MLLQCGMFEHVGGKSSPCLQLVPSYVKTIHLLQVNCKHILQAYNADSNMFTNFVIVLAYKGPPLCTCP